MKQHVDIKAVLIECSMMGPYSNRLRKTFGLPVFDALTASDMLLSTMRLN
jgi:Asp/Glu/hydantoin racemase